MAGVPAAVQFNSTLSRKAQRAALMMAANAALSHFPPTSWKCYAKDGAEAAASSNLSLVGCLRSQQHPPPWDAGRRARAPAAPAAPAAPPTAPPTADCCPRRATMAQRP
jgi:hypothetical protein